MMPVLSHIEKYQDLNFWVTTEGICGVGFQITPCDIETENAEDFGRRLIQVLRQIDSRVLGRVKLEVFGSSDLPETFPRAKAVNAIGFTKKRAFLYLDYVGGDFTLLKN